MERYIGKRKSYLFSNLNSYDKSSVNRLRDFIKNCRQKLKIDLNLFLVALQSNQLADTSYVMMINDDFNKALKAMKDDLTIKWVNGRYVSKYNAT